MSWGVALRNGVAVGGSNVGVIVGGSGVFVGGNSVEVGRFGVSAPALHAVVINSIQIKPIMNFEGIIFTS